MERSLSVSATAAALTVSNHTVYRLIKARKLHAFKVGNVWRINESAIEALQNPAAPKREPRTQRERVQRLAHLAS